MTLFSLMFLTIFTSIIHASELTPWNKVENLKCQKEFNQIANDKNWNQEKYREHVSGSYKEIVFRNQSNVIGEWLEVHLTSQASPVMFFIKDSSITKFSFDITCQVLITNENWPWHIEKIFMQKNNEDWSNDDLKSLVMNGKKGMVYTWSPKFVFSVYELPKMEKLAKKLGYEFTALVDPRASKKEIDGALEVMYKKNEKKYRRQLATKYSYLRNTSSDLYMRGEFNHFPATYIYNNKKIHSRWITGVMKENGIKSLAKTYSDELKGAN